MTKHEGANNNDVAVAVTAAEPTPAPETKRPNVSWSDNLLFHHGDTTPSFSRIYQDKLLLLFLSHVDLLVLTIFPLIPAQAVQLDQFI